jgi:hypothetical protein
MTYLAGLIVVVSYVCMYECRPPPFCLAVCGPLRPIGADAGPGEVESRKPENPPGSPLYYSGREEGRGEGRKVPDFPISLSHI